MKKTLILLVAGTLVFSALPMSFANSAAVTSEDAGVFIDQGWTFTFEDFMKGLKLENLTNTQKTELKAAFDRAVKYEDEGKYEEACKEWESLDQLLLKYFPNEFKNINDFDNNDVVYAFGYEDMSFDDFMNMEKDFLKEISTKDKASLKNAYEAMQKAYASKDETKIANTEKAFWELLDKHFDDEKAVGTTIASYATPISFDDFMKMEKDMLLAINANDMKTLKAMYEATIKADNDKFEEDYDKFYQELQKHYDYKKMYSDKDITSMISDMNLTETEKTELTSLYKTLLTALSSNDQGKILQAVNAFEAKLMATYEKYLPIEAMDFTDFETINGDNTIVYDSLDSFIASTNNNIKPISDTDYATMRTLYKEAMEHKNAGQTAKMNEKYDAIVKIINTYAK